MLCSLPRSRSCWKRATTQVIEPPPRGDVVLKPKATAVIWPAVRDRPGILLHLAVADHLGPNNVLVAEARLQTIRDKLPSAAGAAGLQPIDRLLAPYGTQTVSAAFFRRCAAGLRHRRTGCTPGMAVPLGSACGSRFHRRGRRCGSRFHRDRRAGVVDSVGIVGSVTGFFAGVWVPAWEPPRCHRGFGAAGVVRRVPAGCVTAPVFHL